MYARQKAGRGKERNYMYSSVPGLSRRGRRTFLVNRAIRQDTPHSKQLLSKLDEGAALCPNSPVLAKSRLFIRERPRLADLHYCKMPIKGKTFYISLSLCVQNSFLSMVKETGTEFWRG